jgi:hypothetical protein
MDAVALQLVLGRSHGLSAQLLHSAVEQVGAHAPGIAALEP